MIKFEVGKTYATRSICDYDCIYAAKVIKRTAKFVTIEIDGGVRRCGIFDIGGEECCRPYGYYSMCPVLRASKVAA